jgi:hypothetical protein
MQDEVDMQAKLALALGTPLEDRRIGWYDAARPTVSAMHSRYDNDVVNLMGFRATITRRPTKPPWLPPHQSKVYHQLRVSNCYVIGGWKQLEGDPCPLCKQVLHRYTTVKPPPTATAAERRGIQENAIVGELGGIVLPDSDEEADDQLRDALRPEAPSDSDEEAFALLRDVLEPRRPPRPMVAPGRNNNNRSNNNNIKGPDDIVLPKRWVHGVKTTRVDQRVGRPEGPLQCGTAHFFSCPSPTAQQARADIFRDEGELDAKDLLVGTKHWTKVYEYFRIFMNARAEENGTADFLMGGARAAH